jgi:salicylate hydroxylase
LDIQNDFTVMHFSDGTTASADLVVGADGLKSKTRQFFAPEPASFSGHIAFRALAPVTEKIQHLLDQPGMHIGPGKMVVRYPLRKGSLINLVFFARKDGWTEEGWSIPAELDELREIYAGWCSDVHLLIDSVKPGTIFKWAINQHKPLKSWNLEDKVTLIGDSAHAMTPFMGQGAATGIEDAVFLSRAIDLSDSISEAIVRYEKARLERTSYIQVESNINADRLQGEETELYGLGKLENEESLGLFSYDCVTEPV